MDQQTTVTPHHHQEAAADLHQLVEDLCVALEALPLLQRLEPQALTGLHLRKERSHAAMTALRLVDHAKTRSLCADPFPLTAIILTEGIHAYSTLTTAMC